MYESLEEQNRKYNREHRHEQKIDPKRYPSLWREQQKRDAFDQQDAAAQNRKAGRTLDQMKREHRQTEQEQKADMKREAVSAQQYRQRSGTAAQRPVMPSGTNRRKQRGMGWIVAVVAIVVIVIPTLFGLLSGYLEERRVNRMLSEFYTDDVDDTIFDPRPGEFEFIVPESETERAEPSDEMSYSDHFDEITAAWRYWYQDEDGEGFVVFYTNEDSSYCGYIDRYHSADGDILYNWVIGDTEVNGDRYRIDDGNEVETVEVYRTSDEDPIEVSLPSSENPLYEIENPVTLEVWDVDESFRDFLETFDTISKY